jgi:hypothetical protein
LSKRIGSGGVSTEYGELQPDQFECVQPGETGVAEGGVEGVVDDVLDQWAAGDRGADAAAQATVATQGDEGGAGRGQDWCQRRVGDDAGGLAGVEADGDAAAHQLDQGGADCLDRGALRVGVGVGVGGGFVERPGAVADDAVARAGGVAGVAQVEALDRHAAAAGGAQQAAGGDLAAGLGAADDAIVEAFDGLGGARVEAAAGGVA